MAIIGATFNQRKRAAVTALAVTAVMGAALPSAAQAGPTNNHGPRLAVELEGPTNDHGPRLAVVLEGAKNDDGPTNDRGPRLAVELEGPTDDRGPRLTAELTSSPRTPGAGRRPSHGDTPKHGHRHPKRDAARRQAHRQLRR